VLGDSVAASLTDELLAAGERRQVRLAAAPVSGCGLLPGATFGDDGVIYEPSRSCPTTVTSVLEEALRTATPDVVVWISVWDAEHREIDGTRIRLDTADGRAAVRRLVEARADVFAASGATTVLVTKPDTGGIVRVPDDPARIRTAAYNDVLQQVARERDDVVVVDLAALVCPTGGDRSVCADVDPSGLRYRPSDGIHYEGAPAAEVADWLLAEALDATR